MSFSIPSILLLSVSALSINDGLGSLSAAKEQCVLAFFSPTDLSYITIYFGITQSFGHFLKHPIIGRDANTLRIAIAVLHLPHLMCD